MFLLCADKSQRGVGVLFCLEVAEPNKAFEFSVGPGTGAAGWALTGVARQS